MARPTRPVGEPTRGKTAPNRMRRLDLWLLRHERPLLTRTDGDWADAPFVDLGYGRMPRTTLEAAARFRGVAPGLRVVGVELDPDRVEAARDFEDSRTAFRRGGFELPLGSGGESERARLIRAMNVLRQYDPDAVEDARRRLADKLLPGGLLVEGTCDPFGRLLVVHLLRRVRSGLGHEGLLFSTNFRASAEDGSGFSPGLLRGFLPKALIHRVVPGEAVHRFFADWDRAWASAQGFRGFGVERVWAEAAEAIGAQWPVDRDPRELRRGFLLLRGNPLAA